MASAPLVRRVEREIEKRGILLVTDSTLPSVTGFVTGEPVKGSWWSHPRAREIYGILSGLTDARDLLLVKLVSKKETFVHRALWPELFAVATSKEEWQTRKLPPAASTLLKKIERTGSLRLTRELVKPGRALEERLLVHGHQIHTETGAHAKVLTAWRERAKELKVSFARIQPDAARAAFEDLTSGKLPWPRKRIAP